ncbi:unnamed protein product [Adineta steineri]|uniref:G-protein coupled receptors family 1 profile domain-containing protein n=1 Tax=Adineta steineri TaxID=433720 RepID=A0A815FFH8_9BILA|nr:unnamed protein product [Adineta steineri]CAF1332964.1 unnamed protein product [Adineta steineri]CAF3630517.1 unnamed protein product [Adineta steineri]CAF3684136.1 unnamed protein product [Adineta steineri]
MILPGIWLLFFVCFLTLLGNVLVILAVYREATLHSATYYYIVSLAVADLCVGVIVIPLAICFELLTPPPFHFLCHLWHISDVGASTASILALCVIALDRYIAITSPIRYPRSFIARHSSIVIAIIWFCSAIIAGPTVMVLGNRTNSLGVSNISNITTYDRCEFPSDPLFIIVSSSVSFYIPLLIMVFVYGRILVFARRQMIAFRQGFKRTTSGETYQLSPLVSRFFFRSTKRRNPPSSTTTTTVENIPTVTNTPETITLRIHRGKYSRSPSLPPVTQERSLLDHVSFPVLFVRRLHNLRRTQTWSRFSREHKATKVLGIVMGVFIACWLPFFVFLVLTGVFHLNFEHSKEQLFRLFTWLGYTNSALNFLVYALTSREFRLAFMKLLCPRRYVQRVLKQHARKQQPQ